jgi:hypothetical protein
MSGSLLEDLTGDIAQEERVLYDSSKTCLVYEPSLTCTPHFHLRAFFILTNIQDVKMKLQSMSVHDVTCHTALYNAIKYFNYLLYYFYANQKY